MFRIWTFENEIFDENNKQTLTSWATEASWQIISKRLTRIRIAGQTALPASQCCCWGSKWDAIVILQTVILDY